MSAHKHKLASLTAAVATFSGVVEGGACGSGLRRKSVSELKMCGSDFAVLEALCTKAAAR